MKIKRILNRNKSKIAGIVLALLVAVFSLIFIKDIDMLYFILGISFVIAGLPFFVALIMEGRRSKEMDMMFLEFSRNLVESVKAGTPISKSILNIRNKDYGPLNPHIEKLANQISIGIPLKSALETFARDINNKVITRAVNIIGESEKAGGQIDEILESVVKSVSQIETLKKERVSAMTTLIVQGYIIFIIFLVIMLIMQFKILPMAEGLGSMSGGSSGFSMGLGGGDVASTEELTRPFLWLLIAQGFFAGLTIGKLSEGSIRSGLRHSFILVVMALLIQTGAKAFLG